MNRDGRPDVAVGSPLGRLLLAARRDVPWRHLGHALAGSVGDPLLRVEGQPEADTEVLLRIAGGPPRAFVRLVLGDGAHELPLLGGVLVPTVAALLPAELDAAGRAVLSGRWPIVPATIEPTFQAWIPDPSGLLGWTASNALGAEALPGG